MTKRAPFCLSHRSQLLVLVTVLLTALTAALGTAQATDYYVNSGASCPGSGTSGSPYCSFSSVNSLDLAPGDRILLARGATFNVSTGPSLTLGNEDDGSSVSWNSVEPYGSGAKPIITGANAANTKGVVGTDLDYWKFIEIEFKNASNGIGVTYTTITHTGLRFEKLYIHDMLDASPWTGTGIYLSTSSTNPPVPNSSQWVLKDIQFTDNEFGPIGLYMAVDGINSVKLETFQDIVFMRNYTHDVRWDQAFRYNKNLKWIGNRNERIGLGFLSGGTTDLHLWALHDSTFVNSLFDYVYDSGSHDETFGDIAYRIDQFRFRNNLIEDAAGPGVEWHAWRSGDDYGFDPSANYYTNQELSGNIWRNNGWDTTPTVAGIFEGSISVNHAGSTSNCYTVPSGTVEQNLYYEPTGFLNKNGCSTPSLTETNNLSIDSYGNIYHAGQAFSDAACSAVPEWAEESSTNGSSWTAMTTLNTVNPRTDVRCQPSSGSVPWVNRFEQFPNTGTSYTVARTWTAPSTGTVAIRSRALKAELGGDGVTVRVTKNGTAIIGPAALGASDQVGVVLNADSVAVVAGDKIRFEVDDGGNNTSDRVSWSPAVAYRPSDNGNLALSATTSASSTYAGYCVCRINDGNTADFNGWASADSTMPEWVQLDWTSSRSVSRVELYTTGGYESRDFQVQYWNGSSWVTPSGWSVTGNSQKHRTFTVTPAISTTKIRVNVTLGDAVGGFARIDELEVYGEGGTNPNLAQNASTSSSSTYPGYCDCRVNDLNTSDFNGWASADGVMPDWVQLDWTSSQSVGRVVVYTTTGYVARDFQVQYWNGSSWVTPSGWSVTGNTQTVRTFTVTPAVSTQKIRVNVTLGDAVGGFARIDELEVYSGTNPNLSLSGTTSASSTYAGYCSCRINDASTADFNGWASADGVMPEWVQLDWGSSQTVGRVEFYTTSGYETRDFQVQYWNGSSWTTPSGWSVTGNTLKHRTFTVAPAVSTQKIRVNVTLGDAIGGFARVDELETYAS